jgi:hypothetical protein
LGVEGVAGHQSALELVGGVETECDNAAKPTFGSDAFAVQSEGFGEKLAVFR